jgi:hypothetical protein
MKSPEDLKEYVSKQLKRGYPSGELREELLQQGYAAEAIEKAFSVDGYSSSGPNTDRFGLRSVLLSIGLILLGIWQMDSHIYSTSRMIGIGSLMVGTIGLILKLVDLSGKKW